MRIHRSPLRTTSPCFPCKPTMLSTCLALSLTLVGCGSSDQSEAPGPEPLISSQTLGPVVPLDTAAVFTQAPDERPDILDSAPHNEEDAVEPPAAPAASTTMPTGPGVLANLASAVLIASAEAATGNLRAQTDGEGTVVSGQILPPSAGEKDEAYKAHTDRLDALTLKHPRPTNTLSQDDPGLPDWARHGGYLNQPSHAGRPANPQTGNGSASPPASTIAARSRVLKVSEGGYRLNSPEFKRLYGPGVFNQYALANTIIGSYRNLETLVSNRFLSLNSGYLASLKLYWQTGLGYAGGTGGVIRLRVFPDDGSPAHLPNMTGEPLAQTVFRPGLRPGEDKKSIFQDIPVTQSRQPLQSGSLYHLVMDNLDPQPNDNFISSNNAITYTGTGRPGRWLNTLDWSTLQARRPRGSKRPYTWVNLTEKGTSGNYFSPILQLTMRNGQTQGVSDMEGGSVDGKTVYTATQSEPVRERFTPATDKLVSGLSFSTAASVGGRLGWRILQGENVLASGIIEALRPNYHLIRTNTGLSIGGTTWYDIELPRDIRLRGGQTYDVEFRPQGDSQWKFGDHRNGASYGFRWPAAFTESQAQHFHNGTWINTNHWNYTQSQRGSNWPVVLHLTPSDGR